MKHFHMFENQLLSHDTNSTVLEAKKKAHLFYFEAIAVKFPCACKSFACLKAEQSMKQNGSLCSVIVGNLAAVSLATQT